MKSAKPKSEALSTQTLRMVHDPKTLYITLMEKALRDLELLLTFRTNEEPNRVTDPDKMTKIIRDAPYLITVFGAVQQGLLEKGITTADAAQYTIIALLGEIRNQQLPTREEVMKSSSVVSSILKSNPIVRSCLTILWSMNTPKVMTERTWTKSEDIRSLFSAASPVRRTDEKDEVYRSLRQGALLEEFKKIQMAAQWWLDVLTNPEAFESALQTIRDSREKFMAKPEVQFPIVIFAIFIGFVILLRFINPYMRGGELSCLFVGAVILGLAVMLSRMSPGKK